MTGISIPDHGLPRFESSIGPAGSDLISYAFKRASLSPDLPGAGPRERLILLIPEGSRMSEAPNIGSFDPHSLTISPPQPGVVVTLTFELSMSMSLQQGELINIGLSGFLRNTPVRTPDVPVNVHSNPKCGKYDCTDLELVWITIVEEGQRQSIERYRNATWNKFENTISWENRIEKEAGVRLRMVRSSCV